MAQRVKRLLAMQETGVRSLGREDPRRRKWKPTPVFLPGDFHGQRSLVGNSPWGCRVRHNRVTNKHFDKFFSVAESGVSETWVDRGASKGVYGLLF